MHLDRRRNPFFDHGDAEYFLAEQAGRPVGRIGAIVNHLHNQTHGDRVGFYGFFESVDDTAVARALFETAAAWLRDQGLDAMRGPASFSVNDECGLLVEGFDRPNTIMMPHNPPWYPALHEAAGLAPVRTMLAYQGGDPRRYLQAPERIGRAVEVGQHRFGITLRALRLAEFRSEVDRIKQLYNRCWEHNWGSVPMTDREIDHLAAQFRPVVVPELVPFAEKNGEPIGFGLALPDFNQVLSRHRSGRFLPAALHLLWALKTHRISRIRILLLGVLPEFRGKGVDAMLYHWIWTHAGPLGIRWGEAGWILEDNAQMNAGLVKMGFTVYKTYRMYERPL